MTQERSKEEQRIVVAGCIEILHSDGIIRVAYGDGVEVSLEMQHELHLAFLKITAGAKMPFLFYNKGSFWISKDAREFARSIESKQPFKAVACWAPDLGTRLMADFYGKFYKPKVPYKVFAQESDAVKWLMESRD